MHRRAPIISLIGLALGLGWHTGALAQPRAAADYITKLNAAPLLPITATSLPMAHHKAVTLPEPDLSQPKIAILLPVQASPLAEAAKVILDGIQAAAERDGSAQWIRYDTDEHNVVAQYQRALQDGAKVVIGPLARPHIQQLLKQFIPIPTLALNTIEGKALPRTLYSLNLAVEGEAQALVFHLIKQGKQKPLVVRDGSPLGQRSAQAFSQAWQKQRAQRVTLSALPLTQTPSDYDSVVLAVDKQTALELPTLGEGSSRYATSQLHDNQRPSHFAGIQVVDMPWLTQPDLPVVQRYPRPKEYLTYGTERLYALGIDAWRVALRLAQGQPLHPAFAGVTGELQLNSEQQLQRTLPLHTLTATTPPAQSDDSTTDTTTTRE